METVTSCCVGKAGFGCHRLFWGLGTRVTAIERSDAERVSPLVTMLVSPCRGRGHAATFASLPAQGIDVAQRRRSPLVWLLTPVSELVSGILLLLLLCPLLAS
jgi:hypothetical protein